jgi:hypothetical protein
VVIYNLKLEEKEGLKRSVERVWRPWGYPLCEP